MRPMNSKDRVKGRRLEALDRRLTDIVTLEGGDIPGWKDTPRPGDLQGERVARIVKEKLTRAHIDVENLRKKVT